MMQRIYKSRIFALLQTGDYNFLKEKTIKVL